MKKGIIYIMITAVSGLIKIGKTGVDNYQERMRNLEANGYYNVAGLKRFFAIELEDYEKKEKLLHNTYEKHQVGESELFALDYNLVQQLLLSFGGKIIYPKGENEKKILNEVTNNIKQNNKFNFYKKGLKNGDRVIFIKDNDIILKVVGEKEVEYGGQKRKLSPLAFELLKETVRTNKHGVQGANYFEFNGKKLKDLPDIA